MSSENDLMSVSEIHKTLSNTSVDLHYVFYDATIEEQLRKGENHSWSPLEILIHLRQVGEVYSQRVKRVVEKHGTNEVPFFHDFNEEKQMSQINLQDETAKHNLGKFMYARSQLLNHISFLEEEKWDEMRCRHETSGDITLRQLLIPLVHRERKHLAEIKKLLGRDN